MQADVISSEAKVSIPNGSMNDLFYELRVRLENKLHKTLSRLPVSKKKKISISAIEALTNVVSISRKHDSSFHSKFKNTTNPNSRTKQWIKRYKNRQIF